MIDHLKFFVKDSGIIKQLSSHKDLQLHKRDGMFDVFFIRGNHFRLECSRSYEKERFIGYGYAYLSISPHYHSNEYLHNGNIFTPNMCMKTLEKIFSFLKIPPKKLQELEVINIEYGLNIIPNRKKTDVKELINRIIYYKKTPFQTSQPIAPYYKTTHPKNGNVYKKIKAYAKGLQFEKYPAYNIDLNTFRFEVKSKQRKFVQTLGIFTALDLFKLNSYQTLCDSLLKEWNQVLVLKNNKTACSKSIRKYAHATYWNKLVKDSHRNRFSKEKRKYEALLKKQNLSLKDEISRLFEEQIHSFSLGAFSTVESLPSKNTKISLTKDVGKDLRSENSVQIPPRARVIKLENAPKRIQSTQVTEMTKPTKLPKPFIQQKDCLVCLVTHLDISMQRKGSRFLNRSGLKYYQENNLEIYHEILNRFWSRECRGKGEGELSSVLAHNIRNLYHNNQYRRKKLIDKNQLSLGF